MAKAKTNRSSSGLMPPDGPDRRSSNPCLAAALEAHAAGLCVIPANEGKLPYCEVSPEDGRYTWKHFQHQRPEKSQLEDWFGLEGHRALGLVCGPISGGTPGHGLELFEFEEHEVYLRFKQLVTEKGRADLLGRIEEAYCEQSGGGGIHYLWRTPAFGKTEKLALRRGGKSDDKPGRPKKPTLIEARGAGTFVVIAPSTGLHADGASYTRVSGSLATIPTVTAEERSFLFEVARTMNELPRTRGGSSGASQDSRHAATARGRVDRPGVPAGPRGETQEAYKVSPIEDFNLRGDWAEILAGWTCLGPRDGEHGEYLLWQRPGKDEAGGSATTGYRTSEEASKEFLHVFTTSTEFEGSRNYDRFEAYAILHHDGDRSRACRALAAEGYGETRHRVADGRPEILLDTELNRVADEAVRVLAADPDVFRRGNSLVRLVREAKARWRSAEDPGVVKLSIVELDPPAVLDRISRGARFVNAAGRPARPNQQLASMILSRREWPEIRRLAGVSEVPVLCPDGSIVADPGYDERSELYIAPSSEFPPVSEAPSCEDAREAARRIADLLSDFPFVADGEATWLAALLTVVARHAIAGPVPMFLFDSPTPGTGKSKLADLIAVIAIGREVPRSMLSRNDEEVHKTLIAMAIEGANLVLFDNVPNNQQVGCAAIDQACTGTTMRGRVLCRSETTGELDWNCVMFATGNNLQIRGDLRRRVLLARLESPEVRPETRTGFKYPDLLGHAKAIRASLIVDALTILRAFIRAGRPQPEEPLESMDFPEWSTLVRNAVVWSTGADPCRGRHLLADRDEGFAILQNLVQAVAEVLHQTGAPALSAAALIARADSNLHQGLTRSAADNQLREALLAESRDGKMPSAVTVGRMLNRYLDRPTELGTLKSKTTSGRAVYCVVPPEGQDAGREAALGRSIA